MAQCVALPNAFAHNDYWHKRPLFDALDNGFTNIEADVFLNKGRLIVMHLLVPFCNKSRNLEDLYLKPLYDHISANNGVVYENYDRPITLLIDIKTDAVKTYQALEPLLEKYRSILTEYRDGQLYPRQVTIVLSGHKPYQLVKENENRIAFIDEDLRKIRRDTSMNLLSPMASCKYSHFLKWTSRNRILGKRERKKLCDFVAAAHLQGKKVRLWAAPEKKKVWNELLSCGVDLINTNKLKSLKNYLEANPPARFTASSKE